ncbi:MAG: Uma2 family endonuclease [Planctomycetota bacterium]|nr:MAG: Uma2 family endonuclease [Planctomycetota bacterium]
MIQVAMTVEQFLDQRGEMPECGQWAELHAGVPVFLEPPDVDHGTVVLNLSKALSSYFHSTDMGYACFDLGLHVGRQPDTVYFPAVSVFLKGPRFAESDQAVTVTVPELVIEVLSTPDRQQGVEQRLAQYQTWGVPAVWLINQKTKTVQLFEERGSRNLDAEMMLEDIASLPGFRMPVIELFAIPDWAR